MEYIEKLKWAKGCIESLANGIQPFTGEVLENSILDDPQLIRLFFYVRDALEYSIAKSGKKRPQGEFVLSDELIARIPIIPNKICLSQFLRNIKSVNEDKAPKFNEISTYLISEKILRVEKDSNGKTIKLATEKAKQFGIENEERNSRGQNYTVVVYDVIGQKYLIECLQKIYV